MPRLRQVPRAEAPESVLKLYQALFGDRDPVAQPGTATGTPGDWWTVFALVPEALEHAVAGFGFYRGKNRRVPPKLRELGQTRAGFARGSQFVFSQHCKAMRSLGFTEAQIEAIPSWSVADCFSAEERAVLAYTDCLVLEGGRVPDGVFEALKAVFDDAQIMEFTYTTCMYEMHATMTRALRLEFDDVPERVTEVPVPKGGEQDAMAMFQR
jgi:alkylhydroperoxidase family enzyme